MVKKFNENDSTSAGLGNNAAGTMNYDPDGVAFGLPYFNCSDKTFNNCMRGRAKHKRWGNFLGDEKLTSKIRGHLKASKGKKFLLKNKSTGEYVFANRMFD